MKRQLNKVLVIGANGMLGYAVSEYFQRNGYQVKEVTRKEFNIAKDFPRLLETKISKTQFVINCAGVIKPRVSSYSVEEVLRINGSFPWNLARLCGRLKTTCFHISTDCVFSGKKGLYSEDDFVDAMDLYGLSKAAGDTPLCMTIRTSIIGEEKGRSRSLLEWLRGQREKTVDGFVNHKWNGLTTVYLAEIIEKIISDDLYEPGVFHLHSPRVITKYRLLRLINDVYDLRVTIRKTRATRAIDRTLTSIHELSGKLIKKNLRKQIEEMRAFFSTTKR